MYIILLIWLIPALLIPGILLWADKKHYEIQIYEPHKFALSTIIPIFNILLLVLILIILTNED